MADAVENPTADAADPFIVELTTSGTVATWRPQFRQECTFDGTTFLEVMMNLIQNPNINSSWLFRADILHDQKGTNFCDPCPEVSPVPRILVLQGFDLHRLIVRRLVPRNPERDAPLDQTCLFFEDNSGGARKNAVLYLPHVNSVGDMPFYHPRVRGIAFLHEYDAAQASGSVSVSYSFFENAEPTAKVTQTALNLLKVIHKHGHGKASGYIKRVHHDMLVPQAAFQERYTRLKQKYARQLIKTWAEKTDPAKHVFEDLSLATFLMELWDGMYKDAAFPGFVDIGCGNGLLVYILNREGYSGWGFDARARKSWTAYNGKDASGDDLLRQLVLLPAAASAGDAQAPGVQEVLPGRNIMHDGRFLRGTFIVSNHADELTPWTPLLAAESNCPFIMIPCCSHNLTGAKFRAKPPRDESAGQSTYASLVAWVSELAAEVGWQTEKEMLRIPSTRNTAIIGRQRKADVSKIDVRDVIAKHGGSQGYYGNVMRLVGSGPRGH